MRSSKNSSRLQTACNVCKDFPTAPGRIATPQSSGGGTVIDARATYHIDAKGAELGVEQKIVAAISANNRQRDQTLIHRITYRDRQM